ncbi:MAG: hypothetical protein Q8Q69_05125, partial [Nitrosopumilaceae archaeon]|nr:hypothetical protein [Nitrosopumilaceae archaeon]
CLFIGAWFFFQFLVCDVFHNCFETSYYFAATITYFIFFYGITATGYLIYRKIKQRKKTHP